MQVLSSDAEKRVGITGDDSYKCNRCEVKPAEIFQINGEYCLDCWQTITHTNP